MFEGWPLPHSYGLIHHTQKTEIIRTFIIRLFIVNICLEIAFSFCSNASYTTTDKHRIIQR